MDTLGCWNIFRRIWSVHYDFDALKSGNQPLEFHQGVILFLFEPVSETLHVLFLFNWVAVATVGGEVFDIF